MPTIAAPGVAPRAETYSGVTGAGMAPSATYQMDGGCATRRQAACPVGVRLRDTYSGVTGAEMASCATYQMDGRCAMRRQAACVVSETPGLT